MGIDAVNLQFVALAAGTLRSQQSRQMEAIDIVAAHALRVVVHLLIAVMSKIVPGLALDGFLQTAANPLRFLVGDDNFARRPVSGFQKQRVREPTDNKPLIV